MRTHYSDSQDNIPVEKYVMRCTAGVPNLGRCDLQHGHLGTHQIFGVDTESEEWYRGGWSGGGWVLIEPYPKDCIACGAKGRG